MQCKQEIHDTVVKILIKSLGVDYPSEKLKELADKLLTYIETL